MTRIRGFTLIELLAVIVLASVGMLGVARLFSNSQITVAAAGIEQISTEYLQECAEQVLSVRRDAGFSSALINSSMCAALPTGFVRTVTVPATYTGTASSACPSGISCQNITVTVCAGVVTPCPAATPQTATTLILVQY